MALLAEKPYLELQKQLWKARALAKQKWLEQSLAQPARTADDAAWRITWIQQALDMVKRGRDEIKSQAALMDAYTEHLNVLEMTLIAAVEEKRSTEAKTHRSGEAAEPARSHETAANPNVEVGVPVSARPGDPLKRKPA